MPVVLCKFGNSMILASACYIDLVIAFIVCLHTFNSRTWFTMPKL